MSTNNTYWIVSAGCSKTQSKEGFLNILNSRIQSQSASGFPPFKFDVPDGEQALKFGSFDNLIRLTDDLAKYDSQVEGILRRIERQYFEIESNPEFLVLSQRVKMPFDKYFMQWQWDESKYPKSRQLSEHITLLLGVVNKLDEEGRLKSATFNDAKNQKNALTKRGEGASLQTRDLIDVLTPDVVGRGGDFIETEHLTTLCLIVARGMDVDFQKSYESWAENVVPSSAKKIEGKAMEDKDGNTIWRVVLFKKSVEKFTKAAREHRFIVRDFHFSEEKHREICTQRDNVEEECAKQFTVLKGFCQAAWSDAMIAWVHVKAMRVFVESTLRFGVPPHFGSFVCTPTAAGQPAMRKELGSIFKGQGNDKMAAEADDGEEYYPYVYLSFTPFQEAKSSA